MIRFAPFALFLFIASLTTASAHAAEPTPMGLSVGLGLESGYDGTVTSDRGDSRHGAMHLMLSALANDGPIAFGVVAAMRASMFGDNRWLVGLRAGWQPRFG